MADGTILQAPTVAGDTYDTEDLGARGKVARGKIILGALDTDGGNVDVTNPFPIRISDGSVFVDTVPISVASLPLPTGAATEVTLASLAASISACDTSNVTVVSCALPTGASTEAKQDTIISGLGTIAGKDFATQTTLAALDAKIPALGQAFMVASLPVVLASNQSAIPVTGTFWQATQPVSAASLPLPTGASTEAKQDTMIASLAIIESQASSWLATNTNQDIEILYLTAIAGSVASIDASTFQLLSKDYATQTTLAALNTKVTACNTGAVVLAAGTAVIGHVIVDSGTITFSNSTIAVTNTGTFAVQATLAAGSAVIGHVIVDSGTITAVTAITNALPAGTNLLGKVGIDQTTPGTTNAVQDIPATSGGLSVSSFLSTGAVQSTAIKGTPGQIYSLEFFNVGASAVYVRLYNKASTDDGSGTPVWRGIVPGNTAGAGFVKTWDKGLAFSTGIAMRVTGAIADADTTVLVANQVVGNVCYK